MSRRGWNIQYSTVLSYFCFTASHMEICVSVVGEMPVCADLGPAVFFWFDPQRKQLAVAFWIPAVSTMNCLLMLSERLWLVGNAWCLLYQYLKSRLLLKNIFYNMLIVTCRESRNMTVAELDRNAETFLCRLTVFDAELFYIKTSERNTSKKIKLSFCVVKQLKSVSNLLQITKCVQRRKGKEGINHSTSHYFITA